MNDELILIVDDDQSMRMALADSLETCGYHVETAENGDEAIQKFRRGNFNVVVTDMRMPKMGGMDVLREIKKISPKTPVILITAYGTVKTAVEAMKEGASEFIMKPFSLEDLEFVVKNVLATQPSIESPPEKSSEPNRRSSKEIITNDHKLLHLLELLTTVAKSRSSVLIQGESGTGKELFARYIYVKSKRSHMPFVAINCAAIPHHLLESEMFGFERGAFTGALQRKSGKFELADEGTLLLDEVSEMDVQLQAKLLRVLQEGEVDRLGGKAPVPIDVRIIATTNADLRSAIEEKKFRGDLYYRLNVIPVFIPPLRERMGDVPILADHFLKKYSQANGSRKPALAPSALSLMMSYSWPGNVRELENVMERAILLGEGNRIEADALCLDQMSYPEAGKTLPVPPQVSLPRDAANTTLRDVERALIFDTLNKVAGNKSKASNILGISVRTMRNKLHEYELENAGIAFGE